MDQRPKSVNVCTEGEGGGGEGEGEEECREEKGRGGLSFAYINLPFNYVCTLDVILICMIVYNMKKQ